MYGSLIFARLCNFAAKVLLFFDICKRKGHFLQLIGFTFLYNDVVKCTIIKIDKNKVCL